MAKDKITGVLGIIYCSLVAVCWIFGGILSQGIWMQWYFTLIGLICLIPSAIFYLILSRSPKGGIYTSLGLVLGLAGWVFGLLGRYFKAAFGDASPFDAPVIIFFIALIILGTLLYTRSSKEENPPVQTRDRTMFILGGIYLGLSAPSLIFSFVDVFPGDWGRGGFIGWIFILVGAVLLLMSVILYVVYCRSSKGSVSIGFGLGIAAWALGLLGIIANLGSGWAKPYDSLLFCFFIGLIIVGIIIFARSGKEEAPPPPCPECNSALRYIPEENTFYCDHCKKAIAK